jgi:hypothetical protein
MLDLEDDQSHGFDCNAPARVGLVPVEIFFCPT